MNFFERNFKKPLDKLPKVWYNLITKKKREVKAMTEQQKETLWFLLFEWRDNVLDESIGRIVNADSIDELIEKIEKIVKE